MINNDIENTGKAFNLNDYLQARQSTLETLNKISRMIEPGIDEPEGIELINKELKAAGSQKFWHPTKFRIGKNTLKSFGQRSDLSIKLQKNDIFFIDIGPVFFDHEADLGRTYQVGPSNDFSEIIKASEEIFQETKKIWIDEKLSGKELYQYAKSITLKKGYEFNFDMLGHRLGDFPHALHYKGNLLDFKSTPQKNLWVLEILIRDPSNNFGAFYEDIL